VARVRARLPVGVPPRWNTLNTHVVLWHGTLRSRATNIQAHGIDLTKCKNKVDFGRGFYTTTNETQARNWARILSRNLTPAERLADRPAVLRFRVPLDPLGRLESLTFVRGDPAHDAFWSFVRHCGGSTLAVPNSHLHPGRAAPNDWYDVVGGPVALAWPSDGREVLAASDQFSFHTPAGVGLRQGLITAGAPDFRVIIL
jgi:hypothetical protein